MRDDYRARRPRAMASRSTAVGAPRHERRDTVSLILPDPEDTREQASRRHVGVHQTGSEHSYRIDVPGWHRKKSRNAEHLGGRRTDFARPRVQRDVARRKRDDRGESGTREHSCMILARWPGTRKRRVDGPALRAGDHEVLPNRTASDRRSGIAASSVWVGTTQSLTSVSMSWPRRTLMV